jgi:hypothetical protein
MTQLWDWEGGGVVPGGPGLRRGVPGGSSSCDGKRAVIEENRNSTIWPGLGSAPQTTPSPYLSDTGDTRPLVDGVLVSWETQA